MIGALAAALLLGVGAGVSYAYLLARDDAVNRFRASPVDIEVPEEFEPPGKTEAGQIVKKAPRAVNSSDTACYVRMSVHFSDSDAEALCEPLAINPGWEKGADGFYYWLEPLLAGADTGTLFDHVTIRKEAKEIPAFEILVYAEAVHCGGRGMKEAWEAVL